MTKLHDLYEQQGQSPWLDNLRRDYLSGGRLAELVDEGIRGVTSNPTIFAKAIEAGQRLRRAVRASSSRPTPSRRPTGSSWSPTSATPWRCCDRSTTARTASTATCRWRWRPSLAHDTEGTINAARHFHELVDEPNLYVKIPATAEGVPAIRAMIAEGRSINITLLFSLERYGEVIEAYIGGLEDLAGRRRRPTSRAVRSVASFFVSRVDTEVDRRLDTLAAQAPGRRAPEILRPCGAPPPWPRPSAPTQLFAERFSGPRWEALAAKGAKVQRPLWASTSTKNPAYPDLAYVDTLIGPDTVNTMPDETIAAFLDHGTVARTVDADPDGARRRARSASAPPAWTWPTWPAPSRTKGWPASPSPSTS